MTMTTSPSTPQQELPKSVRGAPAELRRAIRKRQNSESAKRCRLRRKLEAAKIAATQPNQSQRMQQLESIAMQLVNRLAQMENAVMCLMNNGSAANFASVKATTPVQAAQTESLFVPRLEIVSDSCKMANIPTSPMTPTSPMPASHEIDIFTQDKTTVSMMDAKKEIQSDEVESPFSEFDFMSSVDEMVLLGTPV